MDTRDDDDSERTMGEAEPDEGSSGVGAPTLTRSVLLRSVGVPARESGRSMCERAVRGGSELFWVISSMNA